MECSDGSVLGGFDEYIDHAANGAMLVRRHGRAPATRASLPRPNTIYLAQYLT